MNKRFRWQVRFALLPHRLDNPEFQSVVGVANKDNFVNYEMGGVFIAGEWRGHIYSNGVEEQDNLTTIDQVQSELVDYITKHLDRFK